MEELRNFYVSLPTRSVHFDESNGDPNAGFIISATEDEARDLEGYLKDTLNSELAQELKVLTPETMHFEDGTREYEAVVGALGKIYDLGNEQTKAQIQNLGVFR